MNKIKKFFLNLKFRKKIILTYFIVSIVPITILGVFCYKETNELLLNQEKENLVEAFSEEISRMENSGNIYNNVSTYTTFTSSVLDVVNYDYSSYYEMYYKFKNVLDPYIDMIKSLHNNIEQMTVYTSNNITKHSEYIIPIDYIKDKKFYKDISKQYKPYWFYDTDKNLFLAVKFISDESKNIENILYVKLKYKEFFESLYNISNDNCGVYILDKDNNVIFENRNYDKEADYLLPVDQLGNVENGEVYYNNTNYILVKAEIKSTGWTGYLYKPSYLVLESSKNIIYTVLFVVAICFTVLLIIGYGVSYMIVNRIEKLTANMKDMDMEHLEVTVRTDSEDEIGILINSFDKLITKIKTLIQEVYKGEILKRKYEMRALQAQINPHFLYNSLSLINWKAIRAGEEEISEMAQLLSTFYRTSLNKGSNVITIENELNNTEAYVKIQAMMHNYNFDVDFDIDDDIKEYYMINLLLQPLVENAINHGIDEKRNNRGRIRISAKKEGVDIVFEVEDNGVGMSKEMCGRILTSKSSGYGVKNVFDRIKIVYGENYGLEFISIENQGTLARIRISAENNKEKLNEYIYLGE
ncbi:MAG: histidine kinase [Clostridium butyricum]|jgi:two-component system sensor histidine kinase YesM|nr:histidine kinase [Clostridium butyricum]